VASRCSPPLNAHEWLSFEDEDEDRTWVFDVTFLLSNWTCIFGSGCQGVLTEPSPELVEGCCSYGAHFVDEDDAAHVEEVAKTLTAEQWQFRSRGQAKGVIRHKKNGEIVSRLADDACIFLNRPGFPGGPGCALHRAALERGERPLDLKPTVCWQLPLRREDEDESAGHVISRVFQWDRRHWGEGGFEFAWWCTESPDAFVGHRPVYRELRDELIELVGDKPYATLAAHLDQRMEPGRVVLLPHPAVRA
jgi:hypothetical protein